MVVQHGDSIDNNVSLRMNRPLLMKLSTNRSVTSRLTNEPVSFQPFSSTVVEYHRGTTNIHGTYKSIHQRPRGIFDRCFARTIINPFPDLSTRQTENPLPNASNLVAAPTYRSHQHASSFTFPPSIFLSSSKEEALGKICKAKR